MWRGFNLSDFEIHASWARRGRSIFSEHKRQVHRQLSAFAGKDGAIDAISLRDHWFNAVEAQVFISHSHADETLALALAGWLDATFDLRAFVDSVVWGYADDLLREVDDEHCINPGRETYNYAKRNQSTSHVYMMLSSALGKMIDRTECVIFLNTPNSIDTKNTVTGSTHSQWIYSELALTKIINPRAPERYSAALTENFSAEGKTAGLQFRWKTDLSHLIEIDLQFLVKWMEQHKGAMGESHALDTLYALAAKQWRP